MQYITRKRVVELCSVVGISLTDVEVRIVVIARAAAEDPDHLPDTAPHRQLWHADCRGKRQR